MYQSSYDGKVKSDPMQLSLWEENHTLLKGGSDSFALKTSVEKFCLQSKPIIQLIQVQSVTADAIFLKMEFKLF